VRLSRPRLALRAALLAVGGAYMLWHAWAARRAAGASGWGDAPPGARLAVVWALVGALALLTAAGAAMSLRHRPPRKTLRLDGASPPEDDLPRDQ